MPIRSRSTFQEFVHLTGSIYFEQGNQIDASLVAGLAGDLSGLGVPPEFSGVGGKTIQTLAIGATSIRRSSVANGPYWVDSPAGRITTDSSTATHPATSRQQVNSRATGLVIDNLNFGLLLGKPPAFRCPASNAAS